MKQKDTVESLFPKVYNKPPCDLTVPADKVKEIELPKPLGKVFWNELI